MDRRRFKRRLRGIAVLAILLALVVSGVVLAINYLNENQTLVRERCTAVVGTNSYELDPDQASNAALIAGLSVKRGLPARAASIALATAIQESKLRNIDYGDRDSVGLFQQRPSQGWGSPEQLMDPVYATNAFYDVLVEIEGYQNLAVTDAAQRVQRSAFPEAYADHEDEARAFASALTGQSTGALNCVLRRPTAVGDAQQVLEQLTTAFGGLQTSVNGRVVQVQAQGNTGWAIAHWAVANAKALNITAVEYAGLAWSREQAEWAVAETQPDTVRITLAGPEDVKE
ncbi:MAG TPA: hypothetical protein VFI97_01845 [Arthrobacter sp.]|nr:hypothetical protein [Arthrobacter sp.]